MSRLVALILTVAVGGLVAFQPPANASLAGHVSNLGAAFLSLLLSLVIVAVLLLTVGHPGRLSGISSVSPEHALGGISGALIVVISLVTVRSLGVGGVVAALVAAQLVVSLVIDRLGLLGVHEIAITWTRAAGVVLVLAGMLLITKP